MILQLGAVEVTFDNIKLQRIVYFASKNLCCTQNA